MMWIRTPGGKRINLAALAYVEPYVNERGKDSVKVAWCAAGTSFADGEGEPLLAVDHFHGEDAAALLKSLDMVAGETR